MDCNMVSGSVCFEPGLNVEAGACLVLVEFVVAEDFDVGELVAEDGDERGESVVLFGSEGVFRVSVGVESADVADTDGAVVYAFAVCARFFEWAAVLDCSVKVDDVVVSDGSESAFSVPLRNG